MAHTYTNLLTHVLFSTKERQPLIRPEMKSDLYAYMGGIINSLRGKPILINGPKDHVHLLFVLPASLALSDFMEKLKANSSKWVNERSRRRWFAWQTGYAAFSVSQSKLGEVKTYITNQEDHHRRLTYQEEVVALLKKHGMEIDPRDVD
ncbi:MAG TPA: IS200/IS605 family transposase [Terriglobia bacterium]|nr:IS200/IS605 family transposase [Terriglobia bacterium]